MIVHEEEFLVNYEYRNSNYLSLLWKKCGRE